MALNFLKLSEKFQKNPKGIAFSSIYDFMKLSCHIIMDRIKANNRKKTPEKTGDFSGFGFEISIKIGFASVSVFSIYENSVSVSQKRPVNQVFGFS